MAFKMKGNPMRRNFGIGAKPGDQEIKSPDEIRDEASKEVVMDGALDKSTYKKNGDKKPKSRASSTSTSKGGPFDKDEEGGWWSGVGDWAKKMTDRESPSPTDESPTDESSTDEAPTDEPTVNMKDLALGSEERKAEYDRRGWKYDDTISGYNRDGTEKTETPEPEPEQKTEEVAEEEPPATEEKKNMEYQEPTKDSFDAAQRRRQEARIARRRKKGGKSDTYDIRTDKKEARMKYGRGSEEFKKYKQELKDAKAAKRQERRDNS